MYEIKQDLLNNTLLSNQKYHNWINLHKNYIFPNEYTDSYEFDIKNNPQKYIKNMIYSYYLVFVFWMNALIYHHVILFILLIQVNLK